MLTSEPRLCPRCKTVVPTDAPQGMCPRCLLQGGLSAASDPPSTAAHPGPFTAPTVADLGRVFPQLDVLVLSRIEDASTLGQFSRVALAARIVFFGGAAVLPVILPHQLRSAEAVAGAEALDRLAMGPQEV